MMTRALPAGRRAGLWCLLALVAWQAAPSTQQVDWRELDTRAVELYVKGDLPAAIAAARTALQAASSPAETGRSLDRLGFLLHMAGNMTDGEKFLRQSLELREATFGVDSLDYAETANDLALLLRDARRMAEARALAERSVATRRRLLPPDDDLVAETLNTAASIAAMAGDYASAVLEFEQAVAIHESKPESRRPIEEFGAVCVNLAGTYTRLGKYAQAEAAFDKGLRALRVRPGIGHPAYAASLAAYAQFETDLGHYVDAERAYDEAGNRLTATLGDRHPLYATFLNNRGFLHQIIGNNAAAEADYRAALDLRQQIKVPAITMAGTLRNLSYLVYERDRAEGERLLVQAADAYAGSASAPPFDHASVLAGLGRAQRDRGALVEARVTLERARAVAEQGLTPRHALVAATLRELGLVHAAAGSAREAERTLLEALAVAESAQGPKHPAIATFAGSLAEFFASRGGNVEATRFFRRAFDLREDMLAEVLGIGSEHAKTMSIAAASDLMPALMAFQAQAGAQVPEARVLAFEVVTQRKARVLEEVRDWRQRLRNDPSDLVRTRVRDWEAIVACRTSLTMALAYTDLKPSIVGPCALDGTDLQGRYSKLLSDLRTARTDELAAQAVSAIELLSERGDALEASLNRDARGRAVQARVSLETISRRLSDDEILIEFVSYQEPTPSSRRRYGAFVLNRAGRLDWTDVGPAALIDASVGDMLSAANDWSVSLRNREASAARAMAATARDALTDLSRQLWRPLQPLVGSQASVRRLRIAPDGALTLVPFEALSDGRDLIDRFEIAYVQAGRDLTRDAPTMPSAAPVVIVSPGASRRGEGLLASTAPTFRAGTLTALPSAAGEAADLRRLVPAAEVLSLTEATERRLKNVRSPAFVHVIGHGIVLGERPCAAPSCTPASSDAVNAMAGSAIVLEEAYGRAPGSSDDGLLTALELQNVDLSGTEMLVLSQCQMAAGAPSAGEGLYGMRRAAAIAGARTFVAPLWNVEDSVQRRLMQQFYRGLTSGLTRSNALRNAKLVIRRSPATNNFLYWAPVILSGSAASVAPATFRPMTP